MDTRRLCKNMKAASYEGKRMPIEQRPAGLSRASALALPRLYFLLLFSRLVECCLLLFYYCYCSIHLDRRHRLLLLPWWMARVVVLFFPFFFVLLVVHRVGSSLIFFFSFLSRPTFSFLALVVTFLLYSSVRLSDDRQADAQTSESVARGVSLWGIGPDASRRVEALQLVTTDSLRLFQRVARPRLPDLLPCHATVA